MLPSTLPWDWDLRPWSHGESAVPTLRSSHDVNPPRVSFTRSVVAADLAGGEFADEAILAEMLNGIVDDVVGPRGSFLCAPHQGGLRYATEAASRLQAGVMEGWAVESIHRFRFGPSDVIHTLLPTRASAQGSPSLG